MSIKNDKNVSKSFNEDFEILPEDYKFYEKSFKIILIGNESN